jgi:hypothetical protein
VVSGPVVSQSCGPISAFSFQLFSVSPAVACHGSLWRFWLRGTSADEHRKCDEGLDGTFHLCHMFRREAPAPALLHAFKLMADPFKTFAQLA